MVVNRKVMANIHMCALTRIFDQGVKTRLGLVEVDVADMREHF